MENKTKMKNDKGPGQNGATSHQNVQKSSKKVESHTAGRKSNGDSTKVNSSNEVTKAGKPILPNKIKVSVLPVRVARGSR